MKKITCYLLYILISVIFLLDGCSKTETPSTTSKTTYVAPTLAKDTLINIPQNMIDKSKSDGNLYAGVFAITEVNLLSSGLASAFFVNESTMSGWQSTNNSDGSTSFSWKYLYLQIKLTYYNTSSEKWWKFEYDSASYKLPLYYIDDKGTSGETVWYNQEFFKGPQITAYKDTWTKTGTTYNSTFNFYDTTDGATINSQFVSVSNADKSGTLTVYEQNDYTGPLIKSWYYTWTSAGTGSYIFYNTDGTVNYQGTF
jgi:hypothetical protein